MKFPGKKIHWKFSLSEMRETQEDEHLKPMSTVWILVCVLSLENWPRKGEEETLIGGIEKVGEGSKIMTEDRSWEY